MGSGDGSAGRGGRLMHRALLTLMLAGTAAAPAHAAEPVDTALLDAELLEFLGSVDTEADEAWRDYLEERPMRATARQPADRKPARKLTSQPARKKVEKP